AVGSRGQPGARGASRRPARWALRAGSRRRNRPYPRCRARGRQPPRHDRDAARDPPLLRREGLDRSRRRLVDDRDACRRGVRGGTRPPHARGDHPRLAPARRRCEPRSRRAREVRRALGGTVALATIRRMATGLEKQAPFATVEEAIEDIRAGKFVVVVDAADRENEGDLTIAAQFATPEAINFMATHGRGLICLCLTEERCDELGLEPMTDRNETPFGTAFTVSVEAREGIATGISAHDRARTIQVAIDRGKGPNDLVRPGHVFPLRAREGGVLQRAGQTEAAVDLARLAGLIPAGVVCEIMNEDGTRARVRDLVPNCERQGLKRMTGADLIEYRPRHEKLFQ